MFGNLGNFGSPRKPTERPGRRSRNIRREEPEGEKPRPRHVANTFRKFNLKLGRSSNKFHKCGKKSVKATRAVVRLLVKKMLDLRQVRICTSPMLQLHLAKEMKVKLSQSWIQKIFLRKKGYWWLPRRQKRVYDACQRKARMEFA